MKNLKKLPNLILTLLILLSALTSCEKDDGNSTINDPQENIPDTFSEYFGSEISRNFLGTVIDKNHNPIEGATITIGGETAMTDSNGVFIINDATVNQRFGYVKAEKAGYIHGSRSIVPSNGTNKVTIMLLEETVVGTVISGSSETVTSADGSSVSFDGNFIKEDGTAYSGSVDVIMHHLDPADEDMPMQMPGMLYAENEGGAERMLQTLGMLAVELRGSGGEDLNLAEGSTSEIKIPVDASLMSIAPATIPLWYFDEANGYWKEEGQATLEGNMYVGTVSHFSFWNCDIPAEAITLCLTATDEDNTALANMAVSITSTTFGTTYGYTNENGEVCGYVPSNESLVLNVYSYDLCGDAPLYTETVGPFTMDSSITIIVPDNPDVIQETVVGTFNTCSGDAVTDGYVQIGYGTQVFTDAVTNGNFEINLLRCSDNVTFSVEASDFVNLQSTDSISYTFSSPITNIGTITACNTITEFIQYTIDDGDSVLFTDNISTSFYINGDMIPRLSISSYSNNQQFGFYFQFRLNDNPPYTGEYTVTGFNDAIGFGSESQELPFFGDDPNNDVTSYITNFGDVGEYIDVNFSGNFMGLDGNLHSVVGVIHTLRNE
ncbi:hypothetical protein [Winogradskyella sp. SYSU M77433]|uniref:hypothetical protein n=1 Tax=Winogradskyella sp. SYSU M77433 TaxID=3042722 RepID=UPI00247FA43B|nr:hypothetical protein [Winogradskyella sp. SYSU M77433]MDH7911867.1 hypothetical protein [Winogradskyella sp. SYSU M77433]